MKRRIRWLVLILLAGLLFANYLAYHHARSFFFYSEGGKRTPSPEKLSWPERFHVLLNGVNVPKPKSHTTPAAWRIDYREIEVPGRDGLLLSGWLIPATNATVVTVLFHGYSSEKSGMLHEAALFHDLGHEVVLVDFPGHGNSPGNRTTLGIDEARDVAAVLAWARTHWPERAVVLYGHSMGGAAILRAMARFDAKPDAAIVESVFDSLREAVRQRFRLLRVPPFPGAEVLLFWGSVQLGANGFGHDTVNYARAITVPTLVSHGRDDDRADWSRAKRIHDALAGPRAWLLMEDAGHVNPCLSDPERWTAAVSALLDQ